MSSLPDFYSSIQRTVAWRTFKILGHPELKKETEAKKKKKTEYKEGLSLESELARKGESRQ